MKKFILVVVVGFFLFAGMLFPASNSQYKFEKNLHLKKGTVFPNTLVSFNGNVVVSGHVNGSVMLTNGTLTLDGEVDEDVICFASKVVIGKNSIVKRDLFVIGGTLEKHESATIKGEFFFFEFDLNKFENTVVPLLADSQTISFIKAMKLVLWFIAALIAFAIIPRKIYAAEDLFDDNILKFALIGLLSVLTFFFLGIIFLVLSLVGIGIPLLILLFLVFVAVFVLGRTVMLYFIGLKFSNTLHYYHVPPAVYIMEGIIFYAILKFLPVVGPVAIIIINIVEVGIGVGFLLRKRLKFK